MRLLLLGSARQDLIWFRLYYRSICPEGRRKGVRGFETTLQALADMLELGHIGSTGDRELSIARTPFLIVYRLREDRIEVLRIWDQRADRSGERGLD